MCTGVVEEADILSLEKKYGGIAPGPGHLLTILRFPILGASLKGFPGWPDAHLQGSGKDREPWVAAGIPSCLCSSPSHPTPRLSIRCYPSKLTSLGKAVRPHSSALFLCTCATVVPQDPSLDCKHPPNGDQVFYVLILSTYLPKTSKYRAVRQQVHGPTMGTLHRLLIILC